MGGRSREKTIFRLFIIPLVIVMLVQGMLVLGAVFLSGTPQALNQYAVGILDRTTENRRVILENNMIQRWSDVSKEISSIQEIMRSFLKNRNVGIKDVLAEPELQDAALEEMMDQVLQMLRNNGVTGSFLIMADEGISSGNADCRGLYFRDVDPETNTADYSDVLLERGSRTLSHKQNIPFDTDWSSEFTFDLDDSEAEKFFFNPYREAQEHPEASYKDLGYWSGSFSLKGNESYRMITYSVPLIYEGQVYGVLGVEISEQYLEKLLPVSELNRDQESGYAILKGNSEGLFEPVVYSGVLAGYVIDSQPEGIYLSRTEYDSLYQTGDFYASSGMLHLYNSNTPFQDEIWVVSGIQSKDQLFGMGRKVVANISAFVLTGILFGVCSIYFIVRFVTGPIRRLSKCIGSSSPKLLEEYERSGIMEVDGLYDVVGHLTEQQKKAERELTEEKERYQLALESSSDLFFTYDIRFREAELFNLKEEDLQNGKNGSKIHKCVDGEIGFFDRSMIAVEDQKKLSQAFEHPGDQVEMEFRVRKDETKPYLWYRLSARMIYGEDNRKGKMIGSLRDIDEIKRRELEQEEAEKSDFITGLHTLKEGKRRIQESMEKQPEGCMVLLDLDDFRELNEKYGLTFGDAILEEIGREIRFMSQKAEESRKEPVIAVRLGGDEILLWMGRFCREETEEFIQNLQNRLGGIFGKEELELTLSAGACFNENKEDYEVLLDHAKAAVVPAKQGKGRKLYFYHELSKGLQNQKQGIQISEIASLSKRDRRNMVSVTLNFFDKGGRTSVILPVLFMKLASYYKADAVFLSLVNQDFHTSYLLSGWKNGSSVKNTDVEHFRNDQFREYIQLASQDLLFLTEDAGLEEDFWRFLLTGEKVEGISIPLFDGDIYMGSVTVAGKPDSGIWQTEELKNLQEIVKIIQNSINRERYDQASQAKTEFLSRMSHEIRTPMNAIIGMTEIGLAGQSDDVKRQECLEKIHQSSNYLLGLINDILDMAKIESGKMKLEKHDFSLEAFEEEIGVLIRPQAEIRKISYLTDMQIEDHWVSADELHLKQVLINLLGNAVKFTPEDGTVALTLKEYYTEEGTAWLFCSVKDNGIGISEEDSRKIFQSFEQAQNQGSMNQGGTGLGLAISSRLVQMMGGEILLESEPGKGSNFYFTIPVRKGCEAVPQRDTLLQKEFFQGRKVLLVEDNELNAEIARTLLEMNGFTVACARNGKEGVDAFLEKEEGYYDVILMDIRMPVMDGLEAAKQIRGASRKDASSVPIVAMTANAFDEDMKKSIDSGMNGHLTKPIDTKQLLNLLRQLL